MEGTYLTIQNILCLLQIVESLFCSWDELPYMIIRCYIRRMELRKDFKVTLKTGADS